MGCIECLRRIKLNHWKGNLTKPRKRFERKVRSKNMKFAYDWVFEEVGMVSGLGCS